MLLPIFNGALVGLTLAFMIGPALFMLLQTSMLRGFKAGVSFAFGVFLSDGLVLSLVYFSFSKLVGTDPRENMLFNIIGGIVLIIFGTITFLKKSNSEARADVRNSIINDEPSPPYVYAIKGLIVNLFYDLESMIEEQINAVRSMSSGLLDEDFNNIKNWIPNYF